MTTEMICAGFGGQGVLTIGKFIAQAAMQEGKNVSWLPSYGPEMRGGTANVSTVVSTEPIASPIVSFPDVLVALNQPSIDKFAPSIRPGGLLIYNTNMCPNGCKREDITKIAVPMNDIASEIGSMIVLNMLATGVIIGKTNIIKFKTLEDNLTSFMLEKNPDLLAKNLTAIKRGIEIAKQYN
ncbi:MAG: NADH-dependent phenylglyoxylate dehydrogenase subunit gamma [Candidatus Cloacimonetes bacterium ADurb.Bin089]|nr:MAG: NADH-dependent phenylglyoxylate dehydrogenase subunit gamma [Candidatus Cloacimonetes bacterium ADurb.Bin089]